MPSTIHTGMSSGGCSDQRRDPTGNPANLDRDVIFSRRYLRGCGLKCLCLTTPDLQSHDAGSRIPDDDLQLCRGGTRVAGRFFSR